MSGRLKNIFVILLLIFVPLMGLISMWAGTKWSKKIKISLTIFLIIPLLLSATYLFIARPFKYTGSGMTPTFTEGEYFFININSFKSYLPVRGDIVLHKGISEVPSIKRVVGLPGDEIKIQEGLVYVNNIELQEPYLTSGTFTKPGNFLQEGASVKVPADQYFLMGDNRDRSKDSREIGFVDKKDIIGKYWFTYFKP